MGDSPYISSEQGDGLIMRSWLVYLYTNFELNRGVGL